MFCVCWKLLLHHKKLTVFPWYAHNQSSRCTLHICPVIVYEWKVFGEPGSGPFSVVTVLHDDVIKWKRFPRYWPFVRGIHRPPMNSPQKGQWRGALISPLICAWTNVWVNNRDAGDLRRHRAHHAVTVMLASWRSWILAHLSRRRLMCNFVYLTCLFKKSTSVSCQGRSYQLWCLASIIVLVLFVLSFPDRMSLRISNPR